MATASEIISYKKELFSQLFVGMNLPQSVNSKAGAGVISNVPDGHNIVGFGFGPKVTMSTSQNIDALRVYVRQKKPKRDLATIEIIPDEINGIPTDVEAVGDIVAHASTVWTSSTNAFGGDSVGHFNITAGTIGCVVRKRSIDSEDRYILSNNHVLADSNAAKIGDDILHPGPIDGVNPPKIATLAEFQAIDMSGGPNTMDAAIAKLCEPSGVNPEIRGGIGVVQGVKAAVIYGSVRKHGRTTGHTVGVIRDVSADIRVRFGRKMVEFEDQIAIVGVQGQGTPFSSGGDSGSLIVDAVSKEAVGLLFAGGGHTTFANHIDSVLAHFDIEIVGG